MRTRSNQLLVQILLLIVITVIVAYSCVYLAELVDLFSDAIGNTITRFSFGF